jgi:hypothetical protein
VSSVPSRKSTGVLRSNVVNSTGDSAAARVSPPTLSTSQIAGTANSSSLSPNWKACT